MANLGADFGIIGNEAVISNNEGRAYGFEILAQRKSYKGIYGILAYTFVRSEFKDANNNFIPSTWDNRHLLTFTGGKKFTGNWELGAKFRVVGGRPYTPYDLEESAEIDNYDVNSNGILDFTKLNSERFRAFTQLDIRIDKTWFLKHFSINLYLDVQNVLASTPDRQPFLIAKEDVNGNKLIDPSDANKYQLEKVESSSGRALPRIGVLVDF